jgi:hypothetical protein
MRLRFAPEQTLQSRDEFLAADPALDKFIMEKREQRAKALADQEAHPTLFEHLR